MKKILIVDDEEDIRTSVKTILEKNKYKVVTANNGDEGLKMVKKEKPDLVLLDIMMPGTPVKEITPKMKNVNIAFLTVVRTSEAEKESLLKNKNIKDFIQKPFDINDLVNRVKKMSINLTPTTSKACICQPRAQLFRFCPEPGLPG